MADKETSNKPENNEIKPFDYLSFIAELNKTEAITKDGKATQFKDEIELGPGKGKLTVYKTSQVIEQDGILEQAVFVFPSVVTINVGGFNYHSTSYTLTQYADSKLAKMCNGLIALSKDHRGNIFIDRDGETFRYILSFLRTKKLKLPSGFKEFDELQAEAEYYELDELVEECRKVKSKYCKQNSYVRLIYSHKGVVLSGEVKNLVEIIPKPIPGAQLNTGEEFQFNSGDKVVQGAQMSIPLKETQVDALVQHILDMGYVVQGSKVDLSEQIWIFERLR